MSFELDDRIKETTTTSSTGTLTLAGAVTGYRSFADIGNGNSTEYSIVAVDSSGVPTGDWEVSIGVYTASGTTLSRVLVLSNSAGTGLLQSGAGSKIAFAAGTKHVSCGVGKSTLYPRNDVCNGRLTTESGVSVSTSDRTAQGTMYYTPHNGNRVSLYENGQWVLYPFTELSLACAGTVDQIKDVFIYNNAGTLTLEQSAAWSGIATRTDAVVDQDGVSCKSGALNKRRIATVRYSGTNIIETSQSKRYIDNKYNKVAQSLNKEDTATHTYNSSTIRLWNNDAASKMEFVLGDPADVIYSLGADISPAALNTGLPIVYLAADWSGSGGGECSFGLLAGTGVGRLLCNWAHIKRFSIGYHIFQLLESELTNSVSSTFNTTRMLANPWM
jgi:hypothetical protein